MTAEDKTKLANIAARLVARNMATKGMSLNEAKIAAFDTMYEDYGDVMTAWLG